MNVGVIDYGVGNLGSVIRAFEELGVSAALVDRPIDLHQHDRLILPGVGSFTDCIRLLEGGGWIGPIKQEVLEFGRPLLGICVGMQLLADHGMEGADATQLRGTPGLGFIPGKVEHLGVLGCDLRLPHVGWNDIVNTAPVDRLFAEIPDGTNFYFTHSYCFMAEDPGDVIATTEYGLSVTAAVRRGRVWGAQFHPEKSSKAGFKLLENFLAGPTC